MEIFFVSFRKIVCFYLVVNCVKFEWCFVVIDKLVCCMSIGYYFDFL